MRPESNGREGAAEPLEPAGGVRFRVFLEESNGDPFKQFTPGGPVEIWLIAEEQPIDAEGAQGLKFVVLPLAFPNYRLARCHAEGLGIALGSLERAIERAQQAASAPIPTRDDGHRHVVQFARYSRAMPTSAECELCMETLVDDVREWAAARGLYDTNTRFSMVGDGGKATIREAIENAVNRIGEAVDG